MKKSIIAGLGGLALLGAAGAPYALASQAPLAVAQSKPVGGSYGVPVIEGATLMPDGKLTVGIDAVSGNRPSEIAQTSMQLDEMPGKLGKGVTLRVKLAKSGNGAVRIQWPNNGAITFQTRYSAPNGKAKIQIGARTDSAGILRSADSKAIYPNGRGTNPVLVQASYKTDGRLEADLVEGQAIVARTFVPLRFHPTAASPLSVTAMTVGPGEGEGLIKTVDGKVAPVSFQLGTGKGQAPSITVGA